MNKKFKNILKGRPILLVLTTVFEVGLSLFCLIYFNYLDRLTYAESSTETTKDLALLIENMYTNSWWALIILTLCLIAIFSLIALIYKDEKFILITIMLWIVLLILAFNYKDTFLNNLSALSIFLPIIVIKCITFFKLKKLNQSKV